ncbi:AraC family transcriptional regulator [Pseudoalteromonas tunicata]|jgi:AraC family transcriptional regulator|uniref:AraC-family transcriptional regulator n=1 Tax=Pseudoalteromonas tunicata D2 TaxID=87626 RepID=A4CFC6_9GAMM|nr:AraC family transcriptional regulator [Pseudoalteromonas tunicata]ATC92940.1 AraC family transcriptional regulator [Pseudoalteromonas tunicata]AXT32039.1 AraC family transcriptional regulator [Pseudoalteromonas tunicata]EAR26564.1 AraC-family transcriptional regulator [Pseudoalteromonas tunicata D2]
MRASTQSNYQQRLNRVIDYMYQHVADNLDINTLADIACLSPYHFHRIYREMVGEPINVSVRRMRLSKSAALLIRTNKSLAEIAKESSYSGIDAFSRAFSKEFNVSPSLYRKESQATLASHYRPSIHHKEYPIMYTIDMMPITELTLLGLDHQGDYMNIGQTFEKLFIAAASLGLVNQETRSFGLYFDDPKTVAQADLRSTACISVPAATEQNASDPNLKVIALPAGKAATLLFKGPYAELEQPYDWLFGHWLPQSELEPLDFPPFEEYLNDPKNTPPTELLTRIHCLVKS